MGIENLIVDNLKCKIENEVQKRRFSSNALKNVCCFWSKFNTSKTNVIDVGHGGNDSGAIGVNGIQEKDIVLNIAKEIIRLNKMILDDRLKIQKQEELKYLFQTQKESI